MKCAGLTVKLHTFMRLIFPWLLWLAASHLVAAQSSLGKLERVPLFGHEYVRLTDWAAANKFELKWIRPDEEVQVKSSWSKLIFTVDSRKAQINGVSIWLSVNVGKRNGSALVSLLDFQTVIHPLLFPPRNNPGDKVKPSVSILAMAARIPGIKRARTWRKSSRCSWPRSSRSNSRRPVSKSH